MSTGMTSICFREMFMRKKSYSNCDFSTYIIVRDVDGKPQDKKRICFTVTISKKKKVREKLKCLFTTRQEKNGYLQAIRKIMIISSYIFLFSSDKKNDKCQKIFKMILRKLQITKKNKMLFVRKLQCTKKKCLFTRS
jgi:hypothetical protein